MGRAAKFNELLKLLKSAVRIMTSSGHLDHCRPLFCRLGIMTVYSQMASKYILCQGQSGRLHSKRGCLFLQNKTRGKTTLNIPHCRFSMSLDLSFQVPGRFIQDMSYRRSSTSCLVRWSGLTG